MPRLKISLEEYDFPVPSSEFAPSDPGPPPSNRDELYALIRERNVPCNCPDHQKQYPCLCVHHGEIMVLQVGEVPPLRGPIYEVMHLVRAAIQYFTRPENEMGAAQKAALESFRNLTRKVSHFWTRLNYGVGSKWIRNEHMQSLLERFNQIFFFGALELQFAWDDVDSGMLGYYEHDTRSVRLNSLVYALDRPNNMRDLRLDVLLHECVHALICQFACKACESYDVNVQNARGHGRAFQVLSGAVFEGARELLGIGEFAPSFSAGFLAHWDDVRYLPSVHDMETWPDYKKVGHVVQGRRYRQVLFFDGRKSLQEIRHQIGACIETDFGGAVVLKRGTPLLPLGTCEPVLDMSSVIFPVFVLGTWLMLYVALLYLLWILIGSS